MPELPEVQTIVSQLKTKVLNRTFVDSWTDAPNLFKGVNFNVFKKTLKGKKILDINRRGKYIIFKLSDGLYVLAHQKMTGHFMFGKWIFKKGKWLAQNNSALSEDKANKYIHLVFYLDNKEMLAFVLFQVL